MWFTFCYTYFKWLETRLWIEREKSSCVCVSIWRCVVHCFTKLSVKWHTFCVNFIAVNFALIENHRFAKPSSVSWIRLLFFSRYVDVNWKQFQLCSSSDRSANKENLFNKLSSSLFNYSTSAHSITNKSQVRFSCFSILDSTFFF